MSKARRGNKEAKKPKQVPPATAPLLPQEGVTGAPGVAPPPRKKK